jgi:hypothetical protein
MGGRSDLDDVTPGCWLSARKMDLEDAEIRRLGKHPSPGHRIDLISARLKSDRVRTVGTAERTAMGDLGQKPKWMH